MVVGGQSPFGANRLAIIKSRTWHVALQIEIPVFESFWKLLTKYVLAPQAEPAEFEERVRPAKSKLPPPVIWLLGKTQAGPRRLATPSPTRPHVAASFDGWRFVRLSP
jgi:hypothetical protein